MAVEEEFGVETDAVGLKISLAEMLVGGVVVDVSSAEEAKIAETAGAAAVRAVEKKEREKTLVPSKAVASCDLFQKIQRAVSIPVIGRCRIGHLVEAQILEAFFLDFVDESEGLPPADLEHHLDKHAFQIPFVSGCTNFSEALQRISEGTSMVRTSTCGAPESLAHTVQQLRGIIREMRRLTGIDEMDLLDETKRLDASISVLGLVSQIGHLPVPLFASGGIRAPADAALVMQLGADGVFVGQEAFLEPDPLKALQALVAAVNHFDDPEALAKISMGFVENIDEETHAPVRTQEDVLALREW